MCIDVCPHINPIPPPTHTQRIVCTSKFAGIMIFSKLEALAWSHSCADKQSSSSNSFTACGKPNTSNQFVFHHNVDTMLRQFSVI